MSVEVELEKKIIECWGVVDDLDFIFKQLFLIRAVATNESSRENIN